MYSLIWTGFSCEQCGPWASSFRFIYLGFDNIYIIIIKFSLGGLGFNNYGRIAKFDKYFAISPCLSSCIYEINEKITKPYSSKCQKRYLKNGFVWKNILKIPKLYLLPCRYMAQILPIRRKTLFNQLQSINHVFIANFLTFALHICINLA